MSHHHHHSHEGHDHHAHHHPLPDKINLAFGLATGLNLLFTVFEAVYALIAHSMSLLADAGHNLGDVVGLLLSWGAAWLLTRPSNERYSYGYKRTTVLASMINALLLTASCTLILYESILKLIHITAINEPIVMVIALIGIFINGSTALLFMKDQKHDLNIRSAYWHLATDALISVGVLISAIVIYFTHFYWIDPIVALLIVSAILVGTWSLLRQSFDLLLDAVPQHIDYQAVQNYLQTWPGVDAVHDLHIWGLSTREVALTAHLIMPTDIMTDEDYLTINQTLKNRFAIHHATIQIEKGSTVHSCELTDRC